MRWSLIPVLFLFGCSAEPFTSIDASSDSRGDAVSDAGADGALADAGDAMGAGADSPLTCPLTSYVPDPTDDQCRPIEDQACNPLWPCSDAGPLAFHYACSPNFGGPPFARVKGELPCGRLKQGEFCCLAHRCVRDVSLDSTCSKQAGHDYNWACPKGFVPPKYDSGVTAICQSNGTQPDTKLDMLCCDDPGP